MAMDDGDYQTAISILEELAAEFPDDPLLWQYLSNAYSGSAGLDTLNLLQVLDDLKEMDESGSIDMIGLVLAERENYTLIPVPDLDDGPRWRALVVELFGRLDAFVTANPYVAGLLAPDYRIVHPVDLVPAEERVPIDGTLVRREMARGDGWRALVPDDVAVYIEERGLDRRFRSTFGLETLALDAPPAVR